MIYKTLISDLDGTLYYQFPVRLFMFFYLAFYYCIHFFRVKELFLIKDYRKLYEKNFSTDEIIKMAAKKYNFEIKDAEKIIEMWLIKRPLRFIKIFRRRKFINKLKILQEAGIKIIIYSDYPVEEKLKTLAISPDYEFWSGDNFINCMKPNSSGIEKIIKKFNFEKKDILYIGDRNDRDGLCAKNAEVDYIDVNCFIKNFC